MFEVTKTVGNWIARNKNRVVALALGVCVGTAAMFGSTAHAGDNEQVTKEVATYSDYELIESAERALTLPVDDVQAVSVEVVEMSELEEIAWDILNAVDQFNNWMGGKCYAEDIVVPTSPLDTSGLANAAFGIFGDTIETVFPYVLALMGVFLAMGLIKGLARGRS